MNEEQKWNNVVIDSSILTAFMKCARYTQYRYVRNLQPIRGISPAYEKGLLVHKGVETYWRGIKNNGDEPRQLALEKAKEYSHELTNIKPEDKLEVYEHLLQYFQFIGNQGWIPLEIEKHFRKLIYEKYPLRIYLEGRIDLIMRNNNIDLIPIDIKTESERWFHSSLTNQYRIYSLVCGVNNIGIQRFGFQKKFKPEEKFKMETISFEQEILDEFRDDILPYWANQILRCYKTGYWPMNTQSCIQGHFSCDYSDKKEAVCSSSYREEKIARFFKVVEPWEPSKNE